MKVQKWRSRIRAKSLTSRVDILPLKDAVACLLERVCIGAMPSVCVEGRFFLVEMWNIRHFLFLLQSPLNTANAEVSVAALIYGGSIWR